MPFLEGKIVWVLNLCLFLLSFRCYCKFATCAFNPIVVVPVLIGWNLLLRCKTLKIY